LSNLTVFIFVMSIFTVNWGFEHWDKRGK